MAILSEEQVSELQRRFEVTVEPTISHTPAQKMEKQAKARKAYAAKSPIDLDVKVQHYRSWVAQLHGKYGVTVEWYDAKFAEQRGSCAICRQPERIMHHGVVRRLSVDHNHQTDEARGLLCHFCNTQLGALENLEWRQKAEAYLADHEVVIPV